MLKPLWRRPALDNDRGAVLILTLFVVALVTIIVLEYHYDAIVETELAANHANDAKAYYLAMSGLNFARAVLANDTNDYDASNELWHNLESFGCIAPSDLLTIAQTFIESQVKLGDDTPDEPAAADEEDAATGLRGPENRGRKPQTAHQSHPRRVRDRNPLGRHLGAAPAERCGTERTAATCPKTPSAR